MSYEYEPEFLETLQKSLTAAKELDPRIVEKLCGLGSDFGYSALSRSEHQTPTVQMFFDLLAAIGDVEDFKALASMFTTAIMFGYILGRTNEFIYLDPIFAPENKENVQ